MYLCVFTAGAMVHCFHDLFLEDSLGLQDGMAQQHQPWTEGLRPLRPLQPYLTSITHNFNSVTKLWENQPCSTFFPSKAVWGHPATFHSLPMPLNAAKVLVNRRQARSRTCYFNKGTICSVLRWDTCFKADINDAMMNIDQSFTTFLFIFMNLPGFKPVNAAYTFVRHVHECI